MELLDFAAENYDSILENGDMNARGGAFAAGASVSYMANVPVAMISTYK
jgi:hypothetical protein